MGRNFYNRVGHVELVSSSGGEVVFSTRTDDGVKISQVKSTSTLKSYDGLNFRFNIKKIFMGGTMKGSANVDILGLSRESINFISTYSSQKENLDKRLRVRVYAGYEDSGEQLLVDGDIIKAFPSVPPNNWIRIEASVARYRNNDMFSASCTASNKSSKVNGKDGNAPSCRIIDILSMAAKWLELKLVLSVSDESVLQKKVWSFDSTGTKNDIINELNRLGEFYCYEDSGQLFVANRKTDTKGNVMTQVISEETGMIGVPRFDYPNITVQTLINTRLRPFDTVQIESIMIPDASGPYQIHTIDYNGEFRGHNWYQTLHCFRDEESEYWNSKKNGGNIIVKPQSEN